jgi:hypothetical protein
MDLFKLGCSHIPALFAMGASTCLITTISQSIDNLFDDILLIHYLWLNGPNPERPFKTAKGEEFEHRRNPAEK